jgi:hypothetical protein
MSHRHSQPDKHGWNSLHNYVAVHDSCMSDLREYFILADTLQFETIDRRTLRLHGSVYCHGGLVLHVTKLLEINDSDQVNAFSYRYQAQFAEPPIRQIFRYDNAHIFVQEGHEDEYHCHRFSNRTWHEIEPPTWIGYANWPTLREVLDELYEWWVLNREDHLVYP